MSEAISIMWFRRDFRLADNLALRAAAGRGAVLPVYIWSPEEDGAWSPGSASRWWLHQSLDRLQESLRKRGSRLIIRRGPTAETLLQLASESGATAVYWNRLYEPAAVEQGTAVKAALRGRGIETESFPGCLLFEPGSILNGSNRPFTVFTPFWNACRKAAALASPDPAQSTLSVPAEWPRSLPLRDLELEPKIDWAAGIRQSWQPGESGAAAQLRHAARVIEPYALERDRPDHDGTSRLSPHLHFGEITPRQVWHAVSNLPGAEPYLRQLAWREFAHHLLFHFPHTPTEPLRPDFRFFPWRFDEKSLKAWTRGRTGYPLVDAGMRQLWRTGWMHNRVRLAAASFLVKHLLIPWQEGAAWFWDTLVDSDLANNTMGWQWTAGCGADASPFFRIFNPVLQGEKFDPEGTYIRTWIPELSRLPAAWIHKPWQAPPLILQEAGVTPGSNYPSPIVAHDAARKRALAALQAMKASAR